MESFDRRLARRAQGKQPSPIRELLKLASLPDMVSLGGGYPNPTTFVFDSVDIRFKDGGAIRLDGDALASASQYGPSRCDAVLAPLLADWHVAKGGPRLGPESMVVLNGSQEGLFIAAYLLVDEGDTVVVSEPTYPGALSAFSSFGARYLAVPLDGGGMRVDELRRLLDERHRRGEPRPKFIYTIPNGHNPGGVNLLPERRHELLAVAREHDLLVLEDDPYQLLSYDAKPGTTLQELDDEGRVIRLDSFSKIFVPGLRVGYASGRPEIIRHFELFKQSSNLHTSSFSQRILASYLAQQGPDALLRHIEGNCALYRRNRDTMVAAARRCLPSTVRFEVPGSGLFIWFHLPEGMDAQALHATAEQFRVLLVPGAGFSTVGGCRDCMRASFSTLSPERIEEGMGRFAAMLAAGGRR